MDFTGKKKREDVTPVDRDIIQPAIDLSPIKVIVDRLFRRLGKKSKLEGSQTANELLFYLVRFSDADVQHSV